jgi:lysozyme
MTRSPTKRGIVATVGAGAAALLLSYVPQFEGMILRGYADPIGIVTACAGHTKTAILGKPYTRAECDNLLAADLVEHADGVLKCTPVLQGRTYQLAAATSFAFNVGVGAYCKSTMAKLFNAGQFMEACAQLSRWIYAGGRELPGLVTRRQTERAMCEEGLTTEERADGRAGSSRIERTISALSARLLEIGDEISELLPAGRFGTGLAYSSAYESLA